MYYRPTFLCRHYFWQCVSSGYILNYIWEILDTTGSVIWSDTLNNDSIAIFPLISDISSMLLGQQTQANPIGYLDYYIQLTVNNCCGSHTTIDTFTVRPSPRVEFQPYQSGVSLSCTDSNTYLIAGFPVQLILNNYIDMVNTDYIIIDWGDGTPTDSLYPYWYSFLVTHLILLTNGEVLFKIMVFHILIYLHLTQALKYVFVGLQ